MNRGAFHSQKISHTFGKNTVAFKKNPSKIQINPFVLTKSRTLFPTSELPFAVNNLAESFATQSSLLMRGRVHSTDLFAILLNSGLVYKSPT